MKFDGKIFAKELEEKLKERVGEMGKKLRAVSMVVGDDPASIKYSELKKAVAERVGIEFEIYHYTIKPLDHWTNKPLNHLRDTIREFGERGEIDGVMVQLPVPGLQGETLKEVLTAIPLEKDMDGLRWEESGVTPATVRAILAILEKIGAETQRTDLCVCVVGARGAVGRPLVTKLKERGGVIELDLGDELERVKEGEVVISCTGQAGLIKPEMITEGAVVVDVGAPAGDMTKEVYEKASVYVPSHGGVGPVTIVSLLNNLVELYGRGVGVPTSEILSGSESCFS